MYYIHRHKYLRSLSIILCAILLLGFSPNVYGDPISTEDARSLIYESTFYDTSCATPTTTQRVAADSGQTNNAKTIIGIAKTLGLGQRGALIGLMVGLAESGLRNYANDGTFRNQAGQQPYINTQLAPLSLANEHDAVGNDNDSVGVMQQRAIDGHWGPVNPKTDLKGNIEWLMTPTYAAEAFFAMPAGKTETKALVNVANWQTIPPEQAAQAVQVSAYDGRPRDANNFSSVVGGNYKAREPQAQSFIDQYYNSTPALALPVPLASGGKATGSNDANTCASAGGAAIDKMEATISKYAWPYYCSAKTGTRSDTGARCDPMARTPEYAAAISAAAAKGEYTGGCGGVDCGAFVMRVMRDSGADPTYNSGMGNTTSQLNYLLANSKPGGKYIHLTNDQPLAPGDISIRQDVFDKFGNEVVSGHTFIYTGKFTEPNGTIFPGPTASASFCGRAPMSGPNDTRSAYDWFRLR